jgi:cephalosporin-C deacetylase-like acetyl esterase
MLHVMSLFTRSIAVGLLGVFAALVIPAAEPPAGESREQLIRRLNAMGQAQLEERERAVAQIRTQADAERRKEMLRAKILRLIGGLPDERGPLSVTAAGSVTRDGFRIERIIFQSQPGLHVPANVFVPTAGDGPFPAVLLSSGHSPSGKGELYAVGANLARIGIVAMTWDPIGQGERLQHYDPDLGASKVGRATGEHGHASIQTMLMGEHLSRYFIWDAMRGIDYLTSREDVDADHIGAFGCSGGGTMTAYITALDDRVRAAASACYITSFQELLTGAGPQEAEQSIPFFLPEGLDFGDWVQLAAPRPFAIVSTTDDFFPFEGARRTYGEARRIYGLYGAEDRLQWITAKGTHCALGPILPDILEFFSRRLKLDETERPQFVRVWPEHPDELLCTPTGQVSTSLGGETIHSINKKRGNTMLPAKRPLAGGADLERLQARLSEDVRSTAVVSAMPAATALEATVLKSEERENYRLQTVSIERTGGVSLSGVVAIPEGSGRRRTVLMLYPADGGRALRPGGDVDRLARAGRVVFVLDSRPNPAGSEEIKATLLGSFYLLSVRANIVGQTLLGMRSDDVIDSVNWLCSRPDVDSSAITAYGEGPLGVALLHAAALDSRIGQVVVENTLAAYRLIIDQPVHKGSSEVVIPGVLRRYDISDLVVALAPRPVLFINPADAMGNRLRESVFREHFTHVFESDRNLGVPDRVRLQWRRLGEPLPID